MNILIELSLAIIAASLILSSYRFVRGPHIADRIAAFELLTVITIGFCAALSVLFGLSVLFDIAILVCLVSFVGTAGFAALLLKNRENDSAE